MDARFGMIRRRWERCIARIPRSLCWGESGVAVVEFSLILPILIVLLLGFVELANAAENWRKIMMIARTAADLTSQGDVQNPISDAVMADIYAATKISLAPFDVTKADIDISAMGVGVKSSAVTIPYVCSSWSNDSDSRAVGSASDLTVPLNYQRVGARYVMVEVAMPYTPVVGTILTTFIKTIDVSFTWKESVVWPVRGGEASSTASDNEIVLNKTGVKTATICK